MAAASGVFAALARVSPTGSTIIDSIMVGAAAAAVTWAGASTAWWTVGLVCGIAVGVAANGVLLTTAIAGVLISCLIGARRRNMPWSRSVATLLAVQVFARQDLQGFLGLSALIGCLVLAAVFVLGVRRRPRAVRRRTWVVVGATAGIALLSLAALGFSALSARSPLAEGNREARAGLSLLNRGDLPGAAAAFRSAADALSSAADDLTTPWTQPARLLPVVAQNHRATANLAAGGAEAMRSAADSLAGIDVNGLRIVDGKIDLDAVRALVVPFTGLRDAIGRLDHSVGAARSPWLVAPLRHRFDKLTSELRANQVRADNSLLAVRLAPDMLGGRGARHYFVAFTSPSEARGLGGLMGSFAELTIDQGQLTVPRVGRTSELNLGGPDPDQRVITGPEEFVKRWGRFGFVGATDATTSLVPWSNVTMPPDFPTVAQVIAELYPQSGGRQIDGAFAMDPEALAALVTFTGPITIDGFTTPLTAQNMARFIERDQYLISSKSERVELLDLIAKTTIDRLLSSKLPAPADLARTFGPLAQQNRLMAWSANPAEQELFHKVGMDGALPALDGRDGVAVTVDNAAGNKIDAYLDVHVDYQPLPPDGAGQTTGTVTVTLTNNAPATGLPDYVIGNLVDLPRGTNRMLLSVYTALPMIKTEIDSQPAGMETDHSLGWNVATTFLDIPAGGTKVVRLSVSGTIDNPARVPFIRNLPLASPA